MIKLLWDEETKGFILMKPGEASITLTVEEARELKRLLNLGLAPLPLPIEP